MANKTSYASTGTNRTYFAQPYSLSHTGFYFTDLAQYEAGMDKLRRQGAEEVELEYIEGNEAQLFDACSIGQANIAVWFDEVDALQDYERVALYYLTEYAGYDLTDALQELDDCPVFEGSAKEYAEDYVDSCGLLDSLPEQLQAYFNYEAFARDMVLGGDVYEFNYSGTTYTANR
jgi:hypothetical protein